MLALCIRLINLLIPGRLFDKVFYDISASNTLLGSRHNINKVLFILFRNWWGLNQVLRDLVNNELDDFL